MGSDHCEENDMCGCGNGNDVVALLLGPAIVLGPPPPPGNEDMDGVRAAVPGVGVAAAVPFERNRSG